MSKNLKKAIKVIIKAYPVFDLVRTAYVMIKSRGKNVDDKVLIEQACEMMVGICPVNTEEVKVGDETLHCVFNPYFLLFIGRLGCSAIVFPENKLVVYDNTFRKLSQESKIAILAHELGHIKKNHKAGISYMLKRKAYVLIDKIMPMELEADRYAVSIVGKERFIEALTSVSTGKEVRLRVKAIREME